MLSGMCIPRQESNKEAIVVCATAENDLCIRIEAPEKAKKVPRDMELALADEMLMCL